MSFIFYLYPETLALFGLLGLEGSGLNMIKENIDTELFNPNEKGSEASI